MTTAAAPTGWQRSVTALNVQGHKLALYSFMFIVIAHWVEHITQAVQIYALGWARPKAKGALGLWFPWLVTSEWLHYGFAIVMFVQVEPTPEAARRQVPGDTGFLRGLALGIAIGIAAGLVIARQLAAHSSRSRP